MMIEVLKPGLFSTFQDLGRTGFQAIGVPACGAMDEWSHVSANYAVGNAAGDPTLEITMTGPTLRFGERAVIAICGADIGPIIESEFQAETSPSIRVVREGEPITVFPGDVLRFTGRKRGLRTYLAVRGGFGISNVMGSASTYIRGGFGGFSGRALRKGDIVEVKHSEVLDLPPSWPVAKVVSRGITPSSSQAIRIMRGREWHLFSEEAKGDLVSKPFQITPQSDRMGYRLNGNALRLKQEHEILSEAVAFGTIQVPPDGKPIVLMADRQTTGGYPRIAHVAAVDLPVLAQMSPGEVITFREIDINEAHQLLLAWRTW